jgi:hypothetical protein
MSALPACTGSMKSEEDQGTGSLQPPCSQLQVSTLQAGRDGHAHFSQGRDSAKGHKAVT